MLNPELEDVQETKYFKWLKGSFQFPSVMCMFKKEVKPVSKLILFSRIRDDRRRCVPAPHLGRQAGQEFRASLGNLRGRRGRDQGR